MAQDNEEIAVIARSSGIVTYLYEGQEDWQPLRTGVILYDNAVIRTANDGFATVIYLDDKSTVTVRPKSELTIQGQLEGSQIAKTVSMNFGETVYEVTRGNRNFRVETPTSVASVKGTKFMVVVSPQTKSTAVYGISGAVAVTSRQADSTASQSDSTASDEESEDSTTTIVTAQTKAVVDETMGVTSDTVSQEEFNNIEQLIISTEKNDTTAVLMHDLEVIAQAGGVITPAEKQTTKDNQAIEISATADSAYSFIAWKVTSGRGKIEDKNSAKTNVTLNGSDLVVEAQFSMNVCEAEFNTTGNGELSHNGTITVAKDTAFEIIATPDEGYKFVKWVGENVLFSSETSAETEVTFSEDATVEAVFEKIVSQLTIEAREGGQATITAFSGFYGDTISLEATADSGFLFTKWELLSGKATCKDPLKKSTIVILKDSAVSIAPIFSDNSVELSISASEGGKTSITGVVGLVKESGSLNVETRPNPYYRFVEWQGTGGVEISDKNSTKITVSSSSDGTLEAVFEPITVTLTLTKYGEGTVTPTGSHNAGATVYLSASPEDGMVFSSWKILRGTGTVSSLTDPNASVTLGGSNLEMEAIFTGTLNDSDLQGEIQDSVGESSDSSATELADGELQDTVVEVSNSSDVSDDDENLYTVNIEDNGNCRIIGIADTVVEMGESIEISAEEKFGYAFDKWEVVTGQAIFRDANSPTTKVTIMQNCTIRAVAQRVESLEVNMSSASGAKKKFIINYIDTKEE